MRHDLNREVWKQLQEADWSVVGQELLVFAIWWARRYRWKSGSPHVLAKGYTPEDIVQEIIIKTIEGKRKWDPHKGPLVPWLKDQVKSVIDALARSASHRKEVSLPKEENGEEQKAKKQMVKQNLHRLANSEASKEQEETELAEQKVEALFEAVSGKPELEEILDAILSGCEPKPRFLASKLGTNVKDINNRLKRLRRRATKIING